MLREVVPANVAVVVEMRLHRLKAIRRSGASDAVFISLSIATSKRKVSGWRRRAEFEMGARFVF